MTKHLTMGRGVLSGNSEEIGVPGSANSHSDFLDLVEDVDLANDVNLTDDVDKEEKAPVALARPVPHHNRCLYSQCPPASFQPHSLFVKALLLSPFDTISTALS